MDGTEYQLTKGSCLYIGRGAHAVVMASSDPTGGRVVALQCHLSQDRHRRLFRRQGQTRTGRRERHFKVMVNAASDSRVTPTSAPRRLVKHRMARTVSEGPPKP